MRSFTFACVLILAFFSVSSFALRAVPAQRCAGVCGDVTKTTANDIVCSNADMDNTETGKAMKKCLDCQLNSTASDPNTGESDSRWLLYNVRYTMSSCLWSYPKTEFSLSANPCLTNPACGLYEPKIQYDNLSASVSAYDYCGGFNELANSQQPKCQTCLGQLSDDSYLSNFFTILVAGCQQKPNPGTTLSIAGSTIFTPTHLIITTPQATSTGFSSSRNTGPLSLGAIVGVVLGGLIIILIILGCSIICYGKRRRRAKLAARAERAANYNGFGARAPLGGLSEPKWAQNVTPGGASSSDRSPQSAGGYGDKAFSPYMSQYSSPVSARDAINPKNWDWKVPGMGNATGTGESIELERMRNLRLAERKMRDEKIHQEFLNDAAERGFTTSPISRLPSSARDYQGREFPL